MQSSVTEPSMTATVRRRRQLPYKSSPRRAAIAGSAAMLLLLISLVSITTTTTTTTTPFFVESSTLPFGTISSNNAARKQSNNRIPDDKNDQPTTPKNKNRAFASRHRRLFDTRAGSTAAASFVGPASGDLAFESLSYYLRVALAGGVAGATGSAVLYPIDSAKTLRQSDPSAYSSVKDALFQMLKSKHSIQRVYKGILPAALGAIPSSALYFGAYESSKVALQKVTGGDITSETGYRKRLFVHGLAAASGNVLSSFVFVPKEVIKQQLQIRSDGAKTTIMSVVRKKGISGLYAGYGATLLRNIPSATIRFVLYEELKRKWAATDSNDPDGSNNDERAQKIRATGTFLAGAVAGSTSSFVMTPIDVVKTRMATGSCPLGVKSCMVHVVKEVGWKGLYAGAGSRVLWSGAFSAIGFGTFEIVKGYLGVANNNNNSNNNDNNLSTTTTQSRSNAQSRMPSAPMPTKTISRAATT